MRVNVHNTFAGDLTLPLMAARNLFANAVYSAGSGVAVSARSMQTYSFWQGSPYDDLEASGAGDIDYIGCYIRDNDGATIQPQYLDGTVWMDFGDAVSLTEDGPYLWLRGNTSVLAIRLIVLDGSPKVANFKGGKVDILPTGLPIGYQPGVLNPEDSYSNIISEGGQILGSNLLRSGVNESLSFVDIPQVWGHADWPPLRDSLRGKGVPQEAAYFAWMAEDFPDELVYLALSGSPQISYSQGLYLTLELTMAGPDNGL
jgi:hypothetical protein